MWKANAAVVPETPTPAVPGINIPPSIGAMADARVENRVIPHFTRLGGKIRAEWLV